MARRCAGSWWWSPPGLRWGALLDPLRDWLPGGRWPNRSLPGGGFNGTAHYNDCPRHRWQARQVDVFSQEKRGFSESRLRRGGGV